MDISLLLSRAAHAPEPVFTGEWATLWFRPDLGSQQEFIIGVAAVIKGDRQPLVRWLPQFSKLASLYGDALSGAEIRDLASGVELALERQFRGDLSSLTSGTPHIRVSNCGYLATHNVEQELSRLLKRHAGALWADPVSRESAMDEGWAYAEMRRMLSSAAHSVFVPARQISLGTRTLQVGLFNGKSYGNLVSARYAHMQTVKQHVFQSMTSVLAAHNLTNATSQPALFVVLPHLADDPGAPAIARKTEQLLQEVEDAGVATFCESNPADLATKLETWTTSGKQARLT
ncbi:hypothetical protein [Cupriavidus sp. USMAA2-4]|uniref:hypothetical protein n=1 Tax=Cupriavidus sp. USMAA2-4 TaxID=876364 RepID=UPI000A01AF82|nr:hypothetical protein [Cupriavidus sp. USMAA2-4]